MDSLFFLVGPVIALVLVVAPIVSLFRLYRHSQRLDNHEQALMRALERIGSLEDGTAEERPSSEAPAPAPAPEEPAAPIQVAPLPSVAADRPAPMPPGPSPLERWQRFETFLTTRGLVWLGGIIIAIGGALLVRYSIDAGLLGPAVRVALGVALGVALLGGAEWLRRSDKKLEVMALGPDQIPAALSGAGIFTLFASVFGAYYLYDFTSPAVAFVLFATLTTGAFLLSFIQGRLIAVLALLGGYATPILVSTGSGSTLGLFSYLACLYMGIAAVVIFKRWAWLMVSALTLSYTWVVLWTLSKPYAFDMALVQVFLLVTLLISATPLLFDRFYRISTAPPDENGKQARPELLRQTLWAAAIAMVALLTLTGMVGGFSAAILIVTGLAALALFALARYLDEFHWVQALLLPLLIMPILVFPNYIYVGTNDFTLSTEGTALLNAVFAYIAIAAGTGYVGLWGARRPALWASFSAGSSALLFLAAYWRFEGAEFAFEWALGAMTYSAVYLLAAAHVRIYRDTSAMQGVLGAFAVAVTGGVAFGLAIWFDEAILTVALALEVALVGYIYTALPLRPLRLFAMALSVATAVRLLLNYNLLDYNFDVDPVFNWILYGYGVPTVAFVLAARLFGRDQRDVLVVVLESLAIAFAMAFATIEVRQLMAGGLASGWPRFAEHITHGVVWLTAGAGLYYRSGQTANSVISMAWKVILGAGALYYVCFVLLLNNPLLSFVAVGEQHVLNLLLIGYGVPTALFAGLTVVARWRNEQRLMLLFGMAALALLVVYVSLEIRHAFHGSILVTGEVTDMEVYAYSLAFILLAALFMLVGVVRNVYGARQASLALMMLTLVKLGLVDIYNLTGLYRVVSFIGLGFALLGVVYVYRRFVAPSEQET